MITMSAVDRDTTIKHCEGIAKGRRPWTLTGISLRRAALWIAASAVAATAMTWAVLLAVWSSMADKIAVSGAQFDSETLFKAATTRVFLTTLVLLGVFGAIAFIVGALVANRFTGPLRRMGITAQQVADGNYRERVELRRDDYLHDFAENLNDMLDKVEKRFREQQAAVTEAQRRLNDVEITISRNEANAALLEESVQAAIRSLQEARMSEVTEATPYT